ncbi:MAG: short chain dehydrogenase [Acidimicrobiaceae bacterium]|nr:short chain dehydrogenase [Acidimicrobiaceae bacterium]CAI8303060.1 MAG: putative oxidoreductase [Acidimicrobiaceae bacterium]
MATKTPPNYVESHNLLEQKVVVVTAAAGTGIGSAVARRCIEEGATVIISDVHEKRLEATSEALAQINGEKPFSIVCDVTNDQQVQNLFDKTIEEYGKIDVLINNAGLGAQSLLVEMDDEEWSRVIDVTLNGTMRCTRAALKKMQEKNAGVIVNNASVLGWRAQAGQSHYAAAKAGVMALTRCVAIEAAEHDIRVNCVAPSLAIHPNLAKSSNQELIDSLIEQEALGRAAEPWEVANVMVFLASDYSSYMTGEVISVSSQHP